MDTAVTPAYNLWQQPAQGPDRLLRGIQKKMARWRMLISEPAQKIEDALVRTERAGLVLTLTVRSFLVAALIVFILGTLGPVEGWFGAAVGSVFLILGLVFREIVKAKRDREWTRFLFVTLDLLLIAVVGVTAPLSLHGDVPQIFVFRVYGVHIFFFIIAASALSLSPRLVLWTGGACVLTVWGIWAWIVSGMDRWVTWSDLTDNRTAENYISIVLDPDMISIANRGVETLVLIATALVTAAAVSRARAMLRQQIMAERARAEVSEVFGRFVPAQISDALSDSGGVLPPMSSEATVMFVDIENFTSFAEKAQPESIVRTLDAFFDRVSEVVASHDGVQISLIGDAVLAAFNVPLRNRDHAASAIAAGRDLLEVAETETFEGQQFRLRIGIASGTVAAGTVGGRGRRAYTLYGDTVNQAQRLESMNKSLGTRMLVADETWTRAGQPADMHSAGVLDIKGREDPVAAYAPR